MANAVGSVHFEATASTASMRAELDRGRAAIRNFGEETRRALSGGSTGRATGEATSSIIKLGDAVKGAGASIGGFSNAFAAMGDKVNPVVKGLGTAISALAMGGFTPLGLAIGAATAAIGFFAERQSATQEAVERTTTAIERQKSILELRNEVSKDAVDLATDLARLRSGESPQEWAASRRLLMEQNGLAGLLRSTPVGTAEENSTLEGRAAVAQRLQSHYKLIEAQEEEIRQAQRLLDEARARAAVERDVTAEKERQADLTRMRADQEKRLRSESEAAERRSSEWASENSAAGISSALSNAIYAARDGDSPTATLRKEFSDELKSSQKEIDSELKRMADSMVAGLQRAYFPEVERIDTSEFRRLQEQVLEAHATLSRELSLQGASQTEQEVAAVEDKYAQLLAKAREHGVETIELERDLAEQIARIRNDPARRARDEQAERARQIRDGSFGEGFSAGFTNSIESRLMSIGEQGAAVAESLTEGFGNAFAQFATGAMSAKDAFRSFALSFLQDVSAMIAKQFALNVVSGFTGGFSFGGTSAPTRSVAGVANPSDAARSSAWTLSGKRAIGGSMGTAALRSKDSGQGGRPIVNVYPQPGETASVRESRGQGGPQLDIVIERIVAKSISSGGGVDRAIQSRYGSAPRGRRQ